MKYLQFIFASTFAVAILSGALLATSFVGADEPPSLLPGDLQGYAANELNLSNVNIANPQAGVATTAGRIIAFFGGLMGSIAFVMYLWAGVLWLTSAGRKEKIDSAINIFIWTSLGLFAMLSTYVVVNLFFTDILKVQ